MLVLNRFRQKRGFRSRTKKSSWLLATAVLILCGCGSIQVSFYDPTTYRDLTDIKPIMSDLYDTFNAPALDESKIASVSLKLRQMHEYEKGKGKANQDTSDQVGIIIQAFDTHAADRRASGPWSVEHAANKKEYMITLLDTAIESENLKNRR